MSQPKSYRPSPMNGHDLTQAELTTMLEHLFQKLSPSQYRPILEKATPDAFERFTRGTWLDETKESPTPKLDRRWCGTCGMMRVTTWNEKEALFMCRNCNETGAYHKPERNP